MENTNYNQTRRRSFFNAYCGVLKNIDGSEGLRL